MIAQVTCAIWTNGLRRGPLREESNFANMRCTKNRRARTMLLDEHPSPAGHPQPWPMPQEEVSECLRLKKLGRVRGVGGLCKTLRLSRPGPQYTATTIGSQHSDHGQ